MASSLVALTAQANSVTFTDTSFNLANYSETTYKSNPAIGITFDQCPSCGNPNQALQIMVSQVANGDISTIGFVNNTFLYNPSVQGAINTIDASVDKLFNTNQPVDLTTTYANTFRPLIEQDHTFYLAAITGPTFNGGSTGYLNFSQNGLTASDFVEFDFTTGAFGTTNPDFSGDPILFGLAQRTQASSPDLRTVNFELGLR